jgi:hypothetical protein
MGEKQCRATAKNCGKVIVFIRAVCYYESKEAAPVPPAA